MKTITVLNLGAGVQSGCIYQLMADGEYPMADVAIFADTQDEPKWVYEQVAYLKTQPGPEIVEVTAGCLGDDLQHGRDSTGGRFASIPAHTTYQEGVKGGKTRRQCTREYKIEPIERYVRRTMLGLKPKQHIPKDVRIVSLFGFSTDEAGRAAKMRKQMAGTKWSCDFPCFHEDLMMTRLDCKNYIEKRSGFEWMSSACVYCPLKMNHHFYQLKVHDPAGFERGCVVDDALRTTGSVANRDMNEIMYIHRACIPLRDAKLDEDQGTLFIEDEGCDQGCFL